MERHDLPRRGFLQGVGAAVLAAGGAAAGSADEAAAAEDAVAKLAPGPREAWDRLMAGNRRYVAGQSQRLPVTHTELAELEKGQHPFATILGCSDSRVPVELVFDQGLGNLFVIRLAGNVVDTDVVGSIEYAIAHLQTKLLVVLGHEGCGAVTAALAAKADRDKEPEGIRKLVGQIEPALATLDHNLPAARKLQLAVEQNVRQSVQKILDFPGHAESRRQGGFDILGAVYDLHTGRVRAVAVPRPEGSSHGVP